jgi:hypothetical protein
MVTRIYEFPDVPVSKQLFYVPGAAVEGGFTSGGVRMLSPEPGGRAYLDIQLSMRQEWSSPEASWLMSQSNGKVLRVRLTKTPQLVTSSQLSKPEGGTLGPPDALWQAPKVNSGLRGRYVASALEGTTAAIIDMTAFGPILKRGHVIGHGDQTYIIDDIIYSGANAVVTVNPPFRKPVAVNDVCEFEPWFLGTMLSGSDFRATYDAENNGMHQMGKITLSEAIV